MPAILECPLTPIDLSYLSDLIGDDRATLQAVLSTFVDTTKPVVARLDRAIGAWDGGTVRAAAHELKGACGHIGAIEMAAICRELEHAGLTACWSQCERLLPPLRREFRRIVEFAARL